MNTELEQKLVENAKRDIREFGALYDEYYGRIFGYVLNRTASLDVAQDVTSEVFYKALTNISSFHWKGVPFSVWLVRIANNEIANHYRSNGHGLALKDKITFSISISVETPESELETAEAQLLRHRNYLIAQERISKLPAKYQEVLALRFFEGKPLGEIGQVLGKKESTVKTLLYRGLDKLREMLEDETLKTERQKEVSDGRTGA